MNGDDWQYEAWQKGWRPANHREDTGPADSGMWLTITDPAAMSTDELILAVPRDRLVDLVMKLTGGTASPNVVKLRITQIRREKQVTP